MLVLFDTFIIWYMTYSAFTQAADVAALPPSYNNTWSKFFMEIDRVAFSAFILVLFNMFALKNIEQDLRSLRQDDEMKNKKKS